MRALPDHILKALKAWALVTKDRTSSDASYASPFKGMEQKKKRYGFWISLQSFSYRVHRLLGMPLSL